MLCSGDLPMVMSSPFYFLLGVYRKIFAISIHMMNVQEYKEYKSSLAVAVVLSGCYEDDQDKQEEIIYTGQGGNDNLGNKRQIKDQELTGGNLALKVST